MKKIVIALAAVAMAVASQAATFKWTTSATAYGIDAASVVDNGSYTAGTTQMKNKGTWSFILALYDASTGALVGQSASTGIKFGTTNAKVNTQSIAVADAAANTTYNYVLTITGTQNDLTARGVDGAYDYTAATLETSLSGSITTATMGQTEFASSLPTSWTVSGIVPVPEPTSGLMLLLGMAGLALRRKQK